MRECWSLCKRLRLDASALYDRFIGESERKLRDSLAQADRMAPAVLWIDEIFFIDLPGTDAREAILSIHLKRRRRVPKNFDMKRLVAATEGYSGAEIEAGIESALRRAFADGKRPITTGDLVASYAASPPISVVMAGRIEALRTWARKRCVPAE